MDIKYFTLGVSFCQILTKSITLKKLRDVFGIKANVVSFFSLLILELLSLIMHYEGKDHIVWHLYQAVLLLYWRNNYVFTLI